ncbi:unnamed protein product [Closterium sp. Naga37s-1]|nr:unnamed protein product [Closterium sp. Naga37s-1]
MCQVRQVPRSSASKSQQRAGRLAGQRVEGRMRWKRRRGGGKPEMEVKFVRWLRWGLVAYPLHQNPRPSAIMVLSNDIDLLHPPAELEKRKHKMKRLVPTPNSFFMVSSHTGDSVLL